MELTIDVGEGFQHVEVFAARKDADLNIIKKGLPAFPLSQYVVFDLENTVHLESGDPSARRHENKAVLCGYITDCTEYSQENLPRMWFYHGKDHPHIWAATPKEPRVIVGHNIKHDLKFLLRDKEDYVVEKLSGMACWDTMVAEYLLSGQENKFPSLSKAAERFGLKAKDDLIGKSLAAGINVDQIDRDTLRDYLRYDLLLTYLVASEQIKLAEQRGMFRLILTQSQATMAIASIESNGIKVDKLALLGSLSETKNKSESMTNLFAALVGALVGKTLNRHGGYPRNLSPSKTSLLQAVFYGGEYEFEWAYKKSPASKRNSIEKETFCFEGIYKSDPTLPALKTPSGEWSVADDALNVISNTQDPACVAFANCISEYRLAEKMQSTFITGITDNVMGDWHLYGTINQVNTGTGRLSASNPNLQNFPNDPVYNLKQCFVSRWGENGSLIEADFKQIEVVALAYLVGKGPLHAAIMRGEDIHDTTGWQVYDRPITPEEKRLIKGVNFGLIYGGSAATISQQTGLPETMVKDIIKAFYDLYPDVKAWQTCNITEVNRIVELIGGICGHSERGLPIRKATFTLSSLSPPGIGRAFTFTQGDNPYFKATPYYIKLSSSREVNVKPTMIKNYPVQALATGDIVPMVLGHVWRTITSDEKRRDTIKLINTVHDSFLLDVHNDFVPDAIELVHGCISNTPKLLAKTYGITDWELPVKCEIKVGPNWGNLNKVEI